jgi:hypothetical protein
MDVAIAIAVAASERDPRKAKYGIILSDDSSGAFTTYAALWFQTHAGIANYLTKSFPILDCVDDDKGRILRKIAPLVERVRKKKLDDEVLKALNRHAGCGMRLAWWGTFKQLCSASGKVPRHLIAQFRDEYKDEFDEKHEEVAVPPIKSSEIDNYIAFLRELRNG